MARVKVRRGVLGRPGFYQVCGLVLLIAAWALIARYRLIRPTFVPPPDAVWRAAIRAARSGVLASDLLTTLREMLAALALAFGAGFPLGVALGVMRPVKRAVEPLLGLFLTAPLVAFVSVSIIWFGFGTPSVVALGFAAGVVNIIVSTSLAVETIDAVLLRMSRVYCRSPLARLWKVILPASLPTVATGVRFAAGRVVVGVVVGEMFGSSAGLGARLVETANFFDIPSFYVAVVTLAISAFALTSVVAAIEARTRWAAARTA